MEGTGRSDPVEAGRISFVTQPDYLIGARPRRVYGELLDFVAHLRDDCHVWVTLPGAVERWRRDCHQMNVVCSGGGWRVEGPDSERTRVAYASFDCDRLVYEVEVATH